MKGIVTIKKVFPNGKEELVAYDDNVLSINLARSVVNVFSNTLRGEVSDLLVGYFQVGKGTHSIPEDTTLRKYVYSLKEPFVDSDYGPSTTAEIKVHDQVYSAKGNFNPDSPVSVYKGTFATLPDDFSTNVTNDSVYYRLNIGETTGNGQNIQEFGLFSRNPNNFQVDRSSMIAYKTLDDPIIKSDLFSVVIDWQIKFVDGVEEIDTNSVVGTNANGEGYNVVLIMADDLGVDQLGIYDNINPYDLSNAANANISPYSVSDVADGSSIYPYTPTLSGMAAGGITFYNARANTMCTPTRANMLTGKCAFSSPAHRWLDADGNLIYKGLWGHGIATVSTEVSNKLRGGIKGLGAKYLYKNSDPDNVYGVPLGSNMSIEYGIVGGTNSDSVNDRKLWPSSWIGSEQSFAFGSHPGTISGKIPANFTVLPKLIRNTDYVPSGYQSGMVGKWHLAEYDDIWAYSEAGGSVDNPTWTGAKGNGWKHIHNTGAWDYAHAMFANLNKVPIPGHYSDIPSVAPGSPGWYAGIQDSNQGYVNYFQYNYSGLDDVSWQSTSSITTVSDTGYTTFVESAAGYAGTVVPYEQGDASSYATNKTFEDASALFNGMTEPFFLYLPLNAPHSPYTMPHLASTFSNDPTMVYRNKHAQKLYEDKENTSPPSGTWANQNAQIENIDFCLSSFLSSIDTVRKDRTVFIFQGDNGSDGSMMQKYADYASGAVDAAGEADLGVYGGRGGLGCGVGLGGDYYKMLRAGTGDDDPLLTSIHTHRGGGGDSSDFFKSSVYDRGVLIPYIVSASFLGDLAGTSSMAFIDVVDSYATIAHIAGVDYDKVPKTQPHWQDGISFLPVLRGEVDASSHVRQHSFFEFFKPLGGSTGGVAYTGSYTGKNRKYLPNSAYPWSEDNDWGRDQAGDADPSGVGINTIPFERRRGFIKRVSAYQLGHETYSPATNPVYGTLPDASGGMYKIVRPTAGPKFDELYHIRDNNFDAVDQYEFIDLIPASMKGEIISSKLYEAADVTNNDDHFWKLLRIYIAMSRGLQEYLQFRTILPGAVDNMYSSRPEAAARVDIPSIYDTRRSGEL